MKSYAERLREYERQKSQIEATASSYEEYKRRIAELVKRLKI